MIAIVPKLSSLNASWMCSYNTRDFYVQSSATRCRTVSNLADVPRWSPIARLNCQACHVASRRNGRSQSDAGLSVEELGFGFWGPPSTNGIS